jgi:hypothetical protein
MKITQLHNDGSGATMTESSPTPPLPTGGERTYVRLGPRPAVVFRHDRKGDAIYYIHDSRSCERYTEGMIRGFWPAAEEWSPSGRALKHIGQADEGHRSYVDAMRDIEALYASSVGSGGTSADRPKADGPKKEKQGEIARLQSELDTAHKALHELAEVVASDRDATTKVAQLSMSLSGMEQEGLIDPDALGAEAPEAEGRKI